MHAAKTRHVNTAATSEHLGIGGITAEILPCAVRVEFAQHQARCKQLQCADNTDLSKRSIIDRALLFRYVRWLHRVSKYSPSMLYISCRS
jgi:hypothetical protein